MFESIVNLFFPKICAGCAQLLLPQEAIICVRCRHQLPQTHHHKTPQNEAQQKLYGKVPVEFAAAFLFYHKKGIVQSLIQNLKYKNQPQIGQCLGLWYAHELRDIAQTQKFDVVIPVPLHAKRLKERGYNQVAAFGQAVALSFGIPYHDKLLYRNSYSTTQTKKNLGSRTSLAQQTRFEVQPTSADENLHFLLVDDVLTTGSTLEACGRALLKIPGARLSVLCLAMTST
jgi:ComF family protein